MVPNRGRLLVSCLSSGSVLQAAHVYFCSPLLCVRYTIKAHVPCADHPHIVDLKEVMASKDKIYMVMEFMPGGELFDKIVADGPLEVSFILATHLCMHRTGPAGAWPSGMTLVQSSAVCSDEGV